MTSTIRIRMLLLATVTALTALVPAAASPTAADESATTSDEMEAALRLNPGSVQLNDTQVELAKGVIMTIPSADGVTTQGDGWCGAGFVCFWEHAEFEGYSISFYFCGLEDLGQYYMPNGDNWAYDISSWHDEQTGGAFARLWDAYNHLIARTNSPRYQPWVGLTVNDEALLVWTC